MWKLRKICQLTRKQIFVHCNSNWLSFDKMISINNILNIVDVIKRHCSCIDTHFWVGVALVAKAKKHSLKK